MRFKDLTRSRKARFQALLVATAVVSTCHAEGSQPDSQTSHAAVEEASAVGDAGDFGLLGPGQHTPDFTIYGNAMPTRLMTTQSANTAGDTIVISTLTRGPDGQPLFTEVKRLTADPTSGAFHTTLPLADAFALRQLSPDGDSVSEQILPPPRSGYGSGAPHTLQLPSNSPLTTLSAWIVRAMIRGTSPVGDPNSTLFDYIGAARRAVAMDAVLGLTTTPVPAQDSSTATADISEQQTRAVQLADLIHSQVSGLLAVEAQEDLLPAVATGDATLLPRMPSVFSAAAASPLAPVDLRLLVSGADIARLAGSSPNFARILGQEDERISLQLPVQEQPPALRAAISERLLSSLWDQRLTHLHHLAVDGQTSLWLDALMQEHLHSVTDVASLVTLLAPEADLPAPLSAWQAAMLATYQQVKDTGGAVQQANQQAAVLTAQLFAALPLSAQQHVAARWLQALALPYGNSDLVAATIRAGSVGIPNVTPPALGTALNAAAISDTPFGGRAERAPPRHRLGKP